MAHAIEQVESHGIYFATCRHTNHIGACGVYGKMAADAGYIGMAGQQTRAGLVPWGGTERRVGASPLAVVAPVADSFPFYYDASFAMITGAKIKACLRAGIPLPEGVAMDKDGEPTTDPEKAWGGPVMAIGRHKGIGLAMAFEILHSVLSGNVLSLDIPSVVSNPEKSASSSIFMLVIDPGALMPPDEFAAAMKRYVDYVESSPARDPEDPPRYPGRREGENWRDRRANGIPVRSVALERFDNIAQLIGMECIDR
jgi:LDH2 family malate/lactate/ureidoglycolate dehydrogenase